MGSDVVADGLNQIMNSKRVGKNKVVLRRYSKVLTNLLDMMKEKGHIDYTINSEERLIEITINRLNECRAVKPRYFFKAPEIDKYLRRFLPSRKFGSLIVSTNKGLIDHVAAKEQNVGGCIIAYFY